MNLTQGGDDEMQVIAHNLVSQFTNRQLNVTSREKGKTAEKLSSGYKINRSADDAAGLSISEKMRQQIRGLKRGGKNTQEGISWLQVADGAMDEITSIIQRMRELAVQASNDTNTPQDREALDQEVSELRKEINRICLDTEFNTKDVFDNSYVTMDVDGMPGDLQVFDATYDLQTGDVSYGGFVFHGERITWDKVASGMVSVDPTTGKQVFNGGDYSYTDAAGRKFDIVCETGDEVPKITRKIDISADASGITIDGQHIGWSGLIDENGQPFSPNNMHSGAWMLDYEGASVGFFVGSDITQVSDMADAINSCNDGKVTYSWETKFTGTKDEKAVDASVMKELRISNSLAQQLATSPTLAYTVRASKDPANYGIWLEKDGNMVTGSFKSWHELMNETDTSKKLWEEGSYIDSNITYTYSDTDGNNDTQLSFTFTLSDVTSVDSVIDGLDQMKISGKDIKNNYGTTLNITQDKNLLKATSSSHGKISFQDELALERDFEQKEVTVSDNRLTYDKTTGKTELVFNSKSGNPAITYEGNAAGMSQLLDGDLQTYLNFVVRRKMAAAISGANAQDPNLKLSSGSLTDLVGAGNITTSGYFDSTVTIDTGRMTLTDGEGWAQPGENNKTYPTAFIDFGAFGRQYQIDELVGLGFNSTCKTCDRHYSIMFVNGAQGSTTPSGYNYNFREQGRHYTLQIDIDSLKNNNVTNGTDLSKALVEIASECFDFHYTQYAADGDRLYIYDNREQNVGTRDATFDTAPFMAIDTGIYSTTVNTNDGKSISLEYTFNYGDIKDQVIVEMNQDNQGSYVQLADGSYAVYSDTDLSHIGLPRYNLDISYKDRQGNTLTDLSDVVDDYRDFAIDHMLGGSNIELNAKDYTYMKIEGDENHNVAVRPIYESELLETPYENGMHIQNSSRNGDAVLIPRFALNSVVLRLYKADVSTYENAQKTISYADHALGIVSDKRSMYGAYKNRLDHTYAANANTMENTQSAESRLRDADMADEIVKYSKHSILEQAGQSMLAQANQTMQGILSLLA